MKILFSCSVAILLGLLSVNSYGHLYIDNQAKWADSVRQHMEVRLRYKRLDNGRVVTIYGEAGYKNRVGPIKFSPVIDKRFNEADGGKEDVGGNAYGELQSVDIYDSAQNLVCSLNIKGIPAGRELKDASDVTFRQASDDPEKLTCEFGGADDFYCESPGEEEHCIGW